MKLCLAFVMCIALASWGARAQSPEQCALEKDQFKKMNLPLLIGARSTAAEVATFEKNKNPATEALHQFLVRSILTALRRMGAVNGAAGLPRWIDCVQSGIPEYAALKGESGVPTAYGLAGETPRIVVTYGIDRGYEATPQTTYFIEIYSLAERGTWELAESKTPHQFDGGSLSVYKVTGAAAGEYRLLLTGRHYGDTGARLYLELLGFDDQGLNELWSEVKPRTWVVGVSQERIDLGSEEVDKNGRNAHEVTRTFSIEKRGLDPVR